MALRLARNLGDSDLEQWCRLELGGYLNSNPAMDENTVVPLFRTVPGQHTDRQGNVLVVKADLSFVNETRLRYGIEELEALSERPDAVIVIQDPVMCELIAKHLEVEVFSFRFSRTHVIGILSAVRLELTNRLNAIQPTGEGKSSKETMPASKEDIVMLRPNLSGIGVDLRALWRRISKKRRPRT